MSFPDNTTARRIGQQQIMIFAVSAAVCLHILLALMLADVFKPRAYVVDQTTYKVSLNTRASEAAASSSSPSEILDTPDTSESTNTPKQDLAEVLVGKQQEQVASLSSEQSTDLPSGLPVDQISKSPNIAEASFEQTKEAKLETKVETRVKAEVETKEEPVEVVSMTNNAPVNEPSNSPSTAPLNKPEQMETGAVVAEAKSAEEVRSESDSIATESSAEVAEKTAAETAEAETKPKLIAESEVESVSERALDYELGSANNPKPVYPNRARQRGWEGDVVLGVHVDSNGSVTYVEILESSNISALDFAAYSTIKDEWRFSPSEEWERDLRGYVTVPISFRIN